MTVLDRFDVDVYRVPTPTPESDGTLTWDATVAVTATVGAAGVHGLGWTYSAPAAAGVMHDQLAPALDGRDPHDIAGCHEAMRRACRNLGTRGLVMQAISAADIALWDLRARLLGVPVRALLGGNDTPVPVYGSGGFTSMTDNQLAEQIADWRAAGCTAMKIKIGESWGTAIDRDLARVRLLGELAGPNTELMVDANGGYRPGAARRVGAVLDELGVVWFEEPVTSDDLAGLRLLRGTLRCDVAAGEYLSDPDDVRRMLPAVDCVQLDVTRCGGYTGFLAAAAQAAAHHVPVSAHCAPSLHAQLGGMPGLRHIEWFADHARLEPLLFEGVPAVHDGKVAPATSTGHGMSVGHQATRYTWQD